MKKTKHNYKKSLLCSLLFVGILTIPRQTFATIKVYMSPTNNNQSNTTTFTKLDDVQQFLIEQNKKKPIKEDIEVIIAPGVYKQDYTVKWTFTTGYDITFKAKDKNNRPIFDGGQAASFFEFNNNETKPSSISFEYIKIQNYINGITIRDKGAKSNHNLYGNYFYRIGNKFENVPTENKTKGYSAIRLIGTSNASIRNNHFVNIENDVSPASLHAVYFAHNSSNNQVISNNFNVISGDPIRARDNSNNNLTADSTFKKTGYYSTIFSEWRNVSKEETVSVGNIVRNCTYSNNYYDKNIPFFMFLDTTTNKMSNEKHLREVMLNGVLTPLVKTSGNIKS